MREILEAIKSLRRRVSDLERQETTAVGETAGHAAYYRPDDSSLRVPGPVMGAYPAFMGAIPMLQMFSGLVGLWPGWIIGSGTTGNLHFTDLSGHGLDLTRNGGVLQATGGVGVSDLVNVMFFNGSTGYANIADNDILSITGTESGIAAVIRGLTLGVWCKFAVSGNSEGLLTKGPSLFGSSGAYGLYKGAGNALRFSISNGTATHNSSTLTVPIGEWVFACGVFSASSTSLLTYMGTTTGGLTSITDSTGAIASIQDTTQDFVIGGTSGGGNLFDGLMSMPFVCNAAVPYAMINAFYQQTRDLFGV